MKCLIQRVSQASVTVDGETVGAIQRGLLVLVGFEKTDTQTQLDWHCDKLLKLRIFPDAQDKMNLSIVDIQGELLIISQFTLASNCKKGTRPSFDSVMPPTDAEHCYEQFVEQVRKASGLKVETGQFGAMMQVSLVNDGPVTFMLEQSA